MTRLWLRRCVAAAMASLAAICAAQDADPRADAKAALDAATVCCTRFAEFEYRRLPSTFPEQLPIGRGGAAFTFPGGKSFFLAFALPAYEARYLIELGTRVTGWESGGPPATIFCPVVLLLDGSHRPVAIRRPANYQPVRPRTRGAGPGMTTIVTIDDSVRTARYIVFLTDRAAAAGSVHFGGSAAKLPGGTSMTIAGSERIPCAYEGQLEVKGP